VRPARCARVASSIHPVVDRTRVQHVRGDPARGPSSRRRR
jgi:hypothetical protein